MAALAAAWRFLHTRGRLLLFPREARRSVSRPGAGGNDPLARWAWPRIQPSRALRGASINPRARSEEIGTGFPPGEWILGGRLAAEVGSPTSGLEPCRAVGDRALEQAGEFGRHLAPRPLLGLPQGVPLAPQRVLLRAPALPLYPERVPLASPRP